VERANLHFMPFFDLGKEGKRGAGKSWGSGKRLFMLSWENALSRLRAGLNRVARKGVGPRPRAGRRRL